MEAMISFVDAYRGRLWGRADLQGPADRPVDIPRPRRPRRDPEPAPARAKRDASAQLEIKRVFAENFRVYGVRKVWRQLLREGYDVARCTVARLMKKMALQGVIRGRRVRTTVSDKAAPCPLDHVNRRFRAPRPNMLWVSDFTYVATWTGFVYVAFVIDAYARRIVGWRGQRSAHAGFVLDALEQALHDRKPVSRRPRPSLRSRRPVRLDQVHGATGRGRPRAVRRQRRRQLRQRARRDDQRALQGRGDPSARAVAIARGRRVRHARMGRLVQQPPASRADRPCAAG